MKCQTKFYLSSNGLTLRLHFGLRVEAVEYCSFAITVSNCVFSLVDTNNCWKMREKITNRLCLIMKRNYFRCKEQCMARLTQRSPSSNNKWWWAVFFTYGFKQTIVLKFLMGSALSLRVWFSFVVSNLVAAKVWFRATVYLNLRFDSRERRLLVQKRLRRDWIFVTWLNSRTWWRSKTRPCPLWWIESGRPMQTSQSKNALSLKWGTTTKLRKRSKNSMLHR